MAVGIKYRLLDFGFSLQDNVATGYHFQIFKAYLASNANI
jgi:hypothetical protein